MDKPEYAQQVEDLILHRVFVPILQVFYFWSWPVHIVRGPGRGVNRQEGGHYQLEDGDIRSVSPMGALYLMHFVPERDNDNDDYALLKQVAKFRPSRFPEEGMKDLKRGLNLEATGPFKSLWYTVGADLWRRIDDAQTVMMRRRRERLAEHRPRIS